MSRLSFAVLLLVPTLTLAVPLRTNQEHELLAKQWGTVVDPDRDCAFRVERNQLHIVIPGTPHSMSIETGKTNGPRLVRELDGDFTVEVKVLGAIPSDARSAIAGRWPCFAAGLLIWQDDKNYIRFERARMHFANMGWKCYSGFEQREDGKRTRNNQLSDGLLDETKPVHLKVVRSGNTITASFSQDAKEWTVLPALQGEFSQKLRVGVHACHSTTTRFEAIFEGLKVTQGEADKGRDK